MIKKAASKLNEAQREAIEYADGPLLIVAGAGTGKTTVITNKIAHLIESGKAKPEQILALTFTEKAAEEMVTRVDGLIKTGYADLQISTFHAFCQRMLEQYGLTIGLSNQFNLVTETAAWLMVRANLLKFKLDYYRPLGNPTRHIHELLRHFSKCKDELITPEQYLEYAEGVAKEASGGMNNGDAKNDEAGEESKRLQEVAHAYHTYNQLLLDNNSLDFGDLIFQTVRLLEERPAVLNRLRERYKYILVDELQDVNWAQYSLVKLLADETAQLTVVGDDDQSIYAFRGASVSNILRFTDDFPKAKKVILTENYRSNQEILDAAYKSIQNNNPDRLEVKLNIDKHLVSGKKEQGKRPKNKAGSGAVEHLSVATAQDEVMEVIDKIEELKKEKGNEDVIWDDFAILVRANNHAEPFIAELEARKLPYEFVASSGMYRQPIVVDILSFLRLSIDQLDSPAVYRLLRMPFLEIAEDEIHKIVYTAKRCSVSYLEILRNVKACGVSDAGANAVSKLLAVILEGMRFAKTEKPTVVILNFLEKSGYLKYLTSGEERGDRIITRQLNQLTEFMKYVTEFETVSSDVHVLAFVEHITLVVSSGDRGSVYQPSETPDSINILTVHGAKGLEFKYVFVVNLVEERFPTRTRGEAIELPLALIKEQLPEGDFHYQEERRLFYVAMTRAKEKLFLTSAVDYGGARSKKLSRFLHELGYEQEAGAANPRPLLRSSSFGGQAAVPKNDAKILAKPTYELPKSFPFSQLRSYETCPYQYKLAHVLHIPTRGSGTFSFGQSIHATLQAFYERIRALNTASQASLFAPPVAKQGSGLQIPPVEELLKMYESKWVPDWYESQYERERRFASGKEVLKKFYAAQKDAWVVPHGLESFFKVRVGEYTISGRIDRIDQLPDGTFEIIDYKTGTAKEKLSTDDKEQLLIYQLAVSELPEYRHVGTTSKLTYYYVEHESQLSFIGSKEDLQKLKERVVKTIERIHQFDFAATPEHFACSRCPFNAICEFKV
jgi:DNA helicase-2/ATP-dependent DNA helicase PcrA